MKGKGRGRRELFDRLKRFEQRACLALSLHITREFGIRAICYANYRLAQVGEVTISLPDQSCSEGMVPYPERAN